MRFLIDENLNFNIIRGALRRLPALDYLTVAAAGLRGASDAVVLSWAAANGCVVVTHDANTMVHEAQQRLKLGMSFPGLVVIDQSAAVQRAIEDLLLIYECSNESDPPIQFVPLQ